MGGLGRFLGKLPPAELMALCTSCAAASMLRWRSNWMVIPVVPSELDDVIELIPEMLESARSSGVATELAIVSASAPGKSAAIWIVWKSTCGSGARGRWVE